MSKQYGPVTVEAFVSDAGGVARDVDALSSAQRRALADALASAMLSAAYDGAAAFSPVSDAYGSAENGGAVSPVSGTCVSTDNVAKSG